MKAKEKNSKMSVTAYLLLAGFFLYIIITSVPVVWALYTTFKTAHNFALDPLKLPAKWTLSNYFTVYEKFGVIIKNANGRQMLVGLGSMYLNSIFYSLGTAVISTVTCCCVAYVTAVFRWKFSKFLNSLVIVIMMVPIVGSLPAQLSLMRSLGLYNTMTGVYLTTISFTGINYLIFYAAFEQLPRGFIEAGKIDGASNMRIFLQLMFPMVGGIFVTLLLQAFIGRWNDYQTALLWLPKYPTIARGVFHFSFDTDSEFSAVPMQLTACMFLFVPVLAVFLLFHKRLMVNMTMGGLKE